MDFLCVFAEILPASAIVSISLLRAIATANPSGNLSANSFFSEGFRLFGIDP